MAVDLFDNWFDPIESEVRARAREFIEQMIRGELDTMLARPRYGRSQIAGDEESAVVTGHRHGSRTRSLTGTFGPIEIAVPRARLNTADGKTTEWKSKALRAYQRRTLAADALIASTYLAGTNTRRVRRALAALFGGAVGKDTVSRVWRKVKTDWDAWNTRSLADEPIVRLILDGTVVRVRLDRHFHLAARRYRCARGRPEGIARDQEHGRRKRRGMAHCPRRSHQARSATARVPHRRRRSRA
jgi:transposase-like protein